MAGNKRKKPSNAERKAKTQKRQAKLAQGQTSASKTAAVTAKSQSFEAIAKQAQGRKIVLHLGCRMPNESRLHQSFKKDDWFELRLDKNPQTEPHIVADMRNLSMLPGESVDAIYTSHCLDSVPTAFLPALFQQFWRVLKWGGQIGVTVPDMQSIATYVAHDKLTDTIYDSPAGPVAAVDLMYGFRPKQLRGNANVRQSAFTMSSLVDHLRLNGFTNLVVSRKWVELIGSAHKYQDSDPRRKEAVERRVSQKNNQMQLPTPLPLNRVPHPGQFAPNLLTDELDISPKYWQSPGIKDSADKG